MEDRDGEGQLLFPTQWQRANEVVLVLRELQAFHEFIGLAANLIVLHAVDACKETDILGNGEVFIKREPL